MGQNVNIQHKQYCFPFKLVEAVIYNNEAENIDIVIPIIVTVPCIYLR